MSGARCGFDVVFEALVALDWCFERALDRGRGSNFAQVDVLQWRVVSAAVGAHMVRTGICRFEVLTVPAARHVVVHVQQFCAKAVTSMRRGFSCFGLSV